MTVKVSTVVVSGYPADKVEFRQTKGSRVGIECSNRYTGQMGATTLEMLDKMLGVRVTDTTATDGTYTITRDDGNLQRITTKFGEGAVDQKIVVYVPAGATGVLK